MIKFVLGLISGVILVTIIYFGKTYVAQFPILSPISSVLPSPTPKPLEKYTFENLKNRQFVGSEIMIEKLIRETDNFRSYLYFFTSDGKKVSGILNVPTVAGSYPVLIMFRGFVPPEIFESGVGTQHSAEVFAKNGFITLAPDFLGYGESDNPSIEPIEERFETYTTALNILASVPRLNEALNSLDGPQINAITDKVGIWGHSNGGHITLSTLAISGKDYPTVLWNPVSKPFPYSILYYTDDSDDHGKQLRKVIADFEKDYDIELYSPTNFYDWIQSPIQLHQAAQDEAVPIAWSNLLFNDLKSKGKDISYYTYPADDHNFSNGNWNTVVQRNIVFFEKYLKN